MRKVLAVLVASILCFSLCACKDMPDKEMAGGETITTATTIVSYTVYVNEEYKSNAVPNVEVYIYADSSLKELKVFECTGSKGVVTFSLPQSDEYVIVVDNLPEQYEADSFYTFDGNSAAITLKLKQGELPAAVGLGDPMPDFTVTTSGGEKITWSKLLENKQMVLVNFFYIYGTSEFHFIEEAYQHYKDRVGVIGVDQIDEEGVIKDIKESAEISFPLASVPESWQQAFGINGYPTSLIVDRYGDIVLIMEGMQDSAEPYLALFEKMTADNYEQKLYNNIEEIIGG